MKKFVLCIFTVILAAAALIFPVFCETGGYVAFGDSIAAGYGLDSPAEAYPSVMAQTLGFKLQNLAKNGQTSTELKARIAGLSDAEKRAVAEARLITISIGGNDLIGEKNRQFVLTEALISVISGDYTMSDEMIEIYETLKENLTDSIAMLRGLNPEAVILLQTLIIHISPEITPITAITSAHSSIFIFRKSTESMRRFWRNPAASSLWTSPSR